MPEITLSQALIMQRELESKIENLVNEFSTTTNLKIDTIIIDSRITFGQRTDYLVSTEVRL
jgi:hypothetical protein